MKVIIASFLLILFFSFCLGSCRHDCNHHGDCHHSTCECYDGWTGDECSIVYEELLSGDVISKDSDGDWTYFYTLVSDSPVSMTYQVSDGFLSDCDVYIRYNEFPTKNHHDYSDSSWDDDVTIFIQNPTNGMWIAGVYNYLLCSFTISVNIEQTPTCLNDCSGNGVCQDDGTCACNANFSGEDCSIAYVNLSDGETAEDHVDHYEWHYFYFDSVSVAGVVPDFTIIVNQTTDGQDSDLYVKFGELPSLWVYDFRNALVVSDYYLTIGNPSVGRYYIGMYGFSDADFLIHVDVADDTVPNCSDHGFFSANICHCTSEFSGDRCEYMDVDLIEGTSVEGYASSNMWNYYSYTAHSSSNLVLSVDQDWNVGGDCDIFVRANEYPDGFHYDYRDVSLNNSFSVVIQNPLSTPWKIGIYGYHSCHYFITAFLRSTCPNDCSGHGQCSAGRCTCEAGYTGSDCASELLTIRSENVLDGEITSNRWIYYKYSAPYAHTSITVEAMENETQGYINLFIKRGTPPTLLDSDYSDLVTSKYHNLYFQFDGTEGDLDFYIGVYGTTFIPLQATASFRITTYSPPI